MKTRLRGLSATFLCACVSVLVFDCTPAQQAKLADEAAKAANDARRKVNSYCDARQKAIEALGPEGLATGDAGASH